MNKGSPAQSSGIDTSALLDPLPFKLLSWAWFLYLLGPIKFINYHLPFLRPLSWIPELLLWWCAILWMRSPNLKRGYPAHAAFLSVMILGIGVAFVLGNWGVARGFVRQLYQPYLLGLLTVNFCVTPERTRRILAIYCAFFVWFGIWGIISLKLSPLGAVADPALRSIVYWHVNFDNRDAFGPLMVGGLAYSIYYFQATQGHRPRMATYLILVGIAVTVVGFLTSFGRGAFLGFLAASVAMWLRSQRKMAVIAAGVAAVIGLFIVAPEFADKYWASMQTISDGTSKGTGADRKALWTFAWREFLSSPIFGVGTGNYGYSVLRFVSPEESMQNGYGAAGLYARSLHSAPMTILCEYGLIGVISALYILYDFFRTNRLTRMTAKLASKSVEVISSPNSFPPGYVNAAALGLNTAFLAFCISGIFYELIYSPLFWNIMALNRMLYYASGAHLLNKSKTPARRKQGSLDHPTAFPKATIESQHLALLDSQQPNSRNLLR